MSSTKAKLEVRKCKGPVAKQREALAANAAAVAEKDTDGHTRVHSGEVVWCSTCGAYADKKAHAMQKLCNGAPQRGTHYECMWDSYANECGESIPRPENTCKNIAIRMDHCGGQE